MGMYGLTSSLSPAQGARLQREGERWGGGGGGKKCGLSLMGGGTAAGVPEPREEKGKGDPF